MCEGRVVMTQAPSLLFEVLPGTSDHVITCHDRTSRGHYNPAGQPPITHNGREWPLQPSFVNPLKPITAINSLASVNCQLRDHCNPAGQPITTPLEAINGLDWPLQPSQST